MTHIPSDGADAEQAAFDASWDLRTQWHQGRRVRAADFRDRLGASVFALAGVKYALASAEQLARREAGEGPSEEASAWLRAELPDRYEAYSLLLAALAGGGADRRDALPRLYPYLLQPPAAVGELGRLGDYRVLREIGRGGMGVVFEVEHENTHLTPKRRALKVLEPGSGTPHSQARFLAEARILHAIRHPKVVRVDAAGEEEGVAYLEMEFVYGPNLGELIRHHLGGPAPCGLAADLVRQIALGLAQVHRGRYAHRDVKPDNVLLERTPTGPDYLFGWRARVCDFGLAAGAGHPTLTGEGEVPGTLPYLPPEQLIPGAGRGQPEGDMFALGVIAYELVTGRHPFKCASPFETREKILACVVEPPREKNAELPAPLERIILRMLKREQEERPSAEEVVAELTALLGRNEVPTRPALKLVGAPSAPGSGRPPAGAAEKSRSPSGEEPKGSPQATEVQPIVPLALDFKVTVWKKEDKNRSLAIDDPRAAPLRAGDHIRLEIRLNRPAYIYAVQLDASGGASPLSLPRGADGDEGSPVAPRDRLDVPPGELEESVKLTNGPSGVEAFVVLIGERPLGTEEVDRLMVLFASGTKQDTFDPLRGTTWINSDDRAFGPEANRGRVDLAAPRSIEDPVERLRRLLRSDEIGKLSSVYRAVCYPFAGT